jgi:hypothetical protein
LSPGKSFQASMIFASKPEPISRLGVLPVSIKLCWKCLPGLNTLTRLAQLSVTKEKTFWNIETRSSTTGTVRWQCY